MAIFEAIKKIHQTSIQHNYVKFKEFVGERISNLSTLQTVEVGNLSLQYQVSYVNITVYPAINNQRFQCFIRGSPPGDRTITHQVLLRVKPEGRYVQLRVIT